MSFDPYLILLSVVFGLIGWFAFVYGRREASIRHIILAVSLMVFPYFVSSLTYTLVLGSGLTLLLFWP